MNVKEWTGSKCQSGQEVSVRVDRKGVSLEGSGPQTMKIPVALLPWSERDWLTSVQLLLIEHSDYITSITTLFCCHSNSMELPMFTHLCLTEFMTKCHRNSLFMSQQ